MLLCLSRQPVLQTMEMANVSSCLNLWIYRNTQQVSTLVGPGEGWQSIWLSDLLDRVRILNSALMWSWYLCPGLIWSEQQHSIQGQSVTTNQRQSWSPPDQSEGVLETLTPVWVALDSLDCCSQQSHLLVLWGWELTWEGLLSQAR